MPVLVGILVIPTALIAFAPLMLVSFLLIEKPGIALGRQLIRWVGAPPRGRRPSSRPCGTGADRQAAIEGT
jgi:peptidoglycan/LPS O-acetylase OafA/YrhL